MTDPRAMLGLFSAAAVCPIIVFGAYCLVRIPGAAETVVGDGWIAKNDDGLLTSHVHENSSGESGNVAEGLAALLHVFADPVIVAPTTLGVNDDDDDGNGREDVEDASLLDCDDDIAEVHVRFTGPPWMDCTARLEAVMMHMMEGDLWKSRSKNGYVMVNPFSEKFTVRGELAETFYLEAGGTSPDMRGHRITATLWCGDVALSTTCSPVFVERVAEPVTTERVGGHIVNPCCAVIGADTHMRVKVLPEEYPDSRIKWRVVEGTGSFPDGDTGRDVVFRASGQEGETVVLQVDVGDCPGNAPQFTMQTTAMHEVKIYPCVISMAEHVPPADAAKIAAMIDEANIIFRQVGMLFSLGAPIRNLVNDKWSKDGLVDLATGMEIRNLMSGTDGVEVYFIEGSNVGGEPLGQFERSGILVRAAANARTFAHELGHACGWPDIYLSPGEQKARGTEQVPNFILPVREEWLRDDWNNGTGDRFYSKLLCHSDIVDRLLMRGRGSEVKADIPLGLVQGLSSHGDAGDIAVGRKCILTMSPRSY